MLFTNKTIKWRLNTNSMLRKEISWTSENVQPRDNDVEWIFLNTADKLENHLWYLGNEEALSYFYKSGKLFKTYHNVKGMIGRGNNFYAVKSRKGRCIHTGIPKNITQAKVSLLLDPSWDIVSQETNGEDDATFNAFSEEWETIASENKPNEMLRQMATYGSVFGWAFAFPVFDPTLDNEAILWHVPNPMDCIVVKHHNKIVEIRHVQEVMGRKKKVVFVHQVFSKDTIAYEVYEDATATKLVSPNLASDYLADKPGITFNGLNDIPALVLEYQEDDYSMNIGYFDSMDETISTRIDESRRGKLMRFIPEDYLTKDPETGKIRDFQDFDLDFYGLASGPGVNTQGIVVSKVDIDQKKYNDSFMADISMVLPNVGLSPTTLGRFLGGTDGKDINADREKVSLRTRKKLLQSHWRDLIHDMVSKSVILSRFFSAYNGTRGVPVEDETTDATGLFSSLRAELTVPEFDIDFDNYAKPTEEEKQTAISNLYTLGLISLETSLRDLHPDWDDVQIAEEIQRIKTDRGEIAVANLPYDV